MIVASLPKHSTKKIILSSLLVVTVFVLIFSPFFGSTPLALKDIFSATEGKRELDIFWQMRVPRVILAFCAGAIFSMSGMVFQAIFRNPLVSPFTLGVSAGASLGASIYIASGFSFYLLGLSGLSIFSLLGAGFSIILVWFLAQLPATRSMTKLLLAGVVISFFFMSLILFIQYLSGLYQSFRITRWLMGSIYVFGYEEVSQVFPLAIVGLLIIWYFAQELNLLTTGEEIALSRGVDVHGLVKVLFFLISLMIGSIVSVCGPVAFVGIMVPHMGRLMVGTDHRYLTMTTFLFGGIFLVVCDTLARTIIAPAEIPVGIITAILGGPFFFWLLFEQRKG